MDLVVVSVAVVKHHDQKKLEEERVYLFYTSGHELKEQPGDRN